MESEAITLELESSSFKSQMRASPPEVAKEVEINFETTPSLADMTDFITSQSETKVELHMSTELDATSQPEAKVELQMSTELDVTSQPESKVEHETSTELESLKFETTDTFPESAELESLKLEERRVQTEINTNNEIVSEKPDKMIVNESTNETKKRALEEEEVEPVLVRIPSSSPSCSSDIIHIRKNVFKIGRKPDNDEVILSVFVSRNHCVLSLDENSKNWQVTNLSSTDTFLNDIRIGRNETKVIKQGDILKLSESDLFQYKFSYLKKIPKSPKQPRLELNNSQFDTVLTQQKSFVEFQESKRKNLEKELNDKQQEQEELRQKLDQLLKDQNDSKICQEGLNNQILELRKKIATNNDTEMELQNKYKELLSKLEEERIKFEEKLAEEKLKWQQELRETKQEKEKLEMTMVEQMEEYRIQLERKQQAEMQKRIDDLLQEEKNVQTKLQDEKLLLEQKLKEMKELKERLEQEAAAANAKALAAKMAAVRQFSPIQGNIPAPPMDMKKCVILKINNTKNIQNHPVLETIDLTKGAEVASTSIKNAQNDAVIDKVNTIMDENMACSICSELFVRAMTLNCTHTFCRHCIESWIKRRKECPVCRTVIVSMTRSLAIDSFIEKMIESLSPEQVQKRRQLIEERKQLLNPNLVRKKVVKKR